METIQKIERYLAGDFEGEELQQIESQIASDKHFKNEVILHSEINKSILEDDIIELRKTISGILSNKKRNVFTYKLLSGIAASALVLLSLYTIINTESADTTYDRFFQTYLTDLNTRSVHPEDISSANNPYILFEEEKYAQSYQILLESSQINESNTMSYFYLGANATELNKYAEAEKWYKKAMSNTNSPYSLHAKWYLGLNYLKLGEIDLAEKIMLELATTENFYTKKAKRVLRKRIK